MNYSWIILTPPLLVLILALVTRKVIPAIITGIISAALIATHFSVYQSILLILNIFLEESQLKFFVNFSGSPDHIYTFSFLIFLGIIIALITQTGGIAAYSNLINQNIKSKKSVELTSLVLSFFFFIDDYLNSLTVGCVMQPLTDKFSIPRAKLAFLLNAVSSPLCIIVPISSWVAMIVTNLKNSGIAERSHELTYIKADPFSIYLNTIPYIFYAFFIIASAWIIVYFNISYGPMYAHEVIAQNNSNLFGGKPSLSSITLQEKECKIGSIKNFFIPIASFIISVIFFILYTGNWRYFNGTNSFFQALQETDSFFSLFIASSISLAVSIIFFVGSKQVNLKQLLIAIKHGFNLMKNSILVLLLAWILGNILKNQLHVGTYLAPLIGQNIPLFLLPLMIFFISMLICASTGSTWGTISIMIPLTVPLLAALENSPLPLNPYSISLLYPSLGALLSGSLVGSHISPITDATIMASTSAGSYHLDHVTTQLAYVLPAIIGTLVSIIISSIITASYSTTLFLSLTTGFITTLAFLFLGQKINTRHKTKLV